MLKANNIKSGCNVVLYTNNPFILNFIKPKIVSTIRDNNKLINKLYV